jgi:hypothetical protein
MFYTVVTKVCWMLPVVLASFFFLDQKKNPASAKRNASAEMLATAAITVRAFLDLLVEPA